VRPAGRTRRLPTERAGAGPAEAVGADVPALAERLLHPEGSVRRVAAMDLAAIGTRAALVLLMTHLALEDDERAIVLIARALAAHGYGPARRLLATVRDDPETPARAYHAALVAHDRLERLAGEAAPRA